MKAVSTIAVLALLALGAFAAVSICAGPSCTNCTVMFPQGPGECIREGTSSRQYACAAGNATVIEYDNTDCSGVPDDLTIYAEGCNAAGNFIITCSASWAAAVMAVAALIAMLL